MNVLVEKGSNYMAMKVIMTFNKDAVLEKGYSLDKIYAAIKAAFREDGLPCVSDGEVLTFTGNGSKNDWACIWNNIGNLMLSSWFVETASSLLFIKNGNVEDVLAQAHKFDVLRK